MSVKSFARAARDVWIALLFFLIGTLLRTVLYRYSWCPSSLLILNLQAFHWSNTLLNHGQSWSSCKHSRWFHCEVSIGNPVWCVDSVTKLRSSELFVLRICMPSTTFYRALDSCLLRLCLLELISSLPSLLEHPLSSFRIEKSLTLFLRFRTIQRSRGENWSSQGLFLSGRCLPYHKLHSGIWWAETGHWFGRVSLSSIYVFQIHGIVTEGGSWRHDSMANLLGIFFFTYCYRGSLHIHGKADSLLLRY